MMNMSDLENSMKSFEIKEYLDKNQPIILRIDGANFKNYTKCFNKPFDEIISEAMIESCQTLCKQIQGVKLGFTHSDELSIIFTANDNENTDGWFGLEKSKMISHATSIAVGTFNSFLTNNIDEIISPAKFDCRINNYPVEKVRDYIVWRSNSCFTNALNSISSHYFSHKELLEKSNSERIKMLIEKQIDVFSYPLKYLTGTFFIKEPVEIETEYGKIKRNKFKKQYFKKIPDNILDIIFKNEEVNDKI